MVAPAGPIAARAVTVDAGPLGRDDARLAGGDQPPPRALTVDSQLARCRPAVPNGPGSAAMVPGPAGRRVAPRPPIDQRIADGLAGRTRTGWSTIASARGAPRAAVRRPPSRRREKPPTPPADRASRPAQGPTGGSGPAQPGDDRGIRWCRRRRHRRATPTHRGRRAVPAAQVATWRWPASEAKRRGLRARRRRGLDDVPACGRNRSVATYVWW